MGFIFRWLGGLLFLILLGGLVVAFFGPRETVNTEITFDPSVIGDDVDAYLAGAETVYDDITPGVEKRVIWAGERGAKTSRAVLYVHGFSATSEEIRPVPDRVAEALGANLVFTRLTGHGRPGEAMAEATVNAWMNDMAEALAVARSVGDEVIVISTSTGATLATMAQANPTLAEGIAAHVFISPNFGLASAASAILTWPGVRSWGPVVAGRERTFDVINEEHGRYWTTRYPTVALLPMAAAVKHARNLDHGALTAPLLAIYSNEDKVVSADHTRFVAIRWGARVTRQEVQLEEGNDPYHHVLAGDILSPGNTDNTVETILNWLATL